MSTPTSNADHIYHVWINRRQEERRAAGEEWEGSLYEFKDLLHFINYGHTLLEKAFTDKLPTIHQQCSHSSPEKIEGNRLVCCLGQEVTTCPILLSLKGTVEEERGRIAPWNGEAHYANVDDAQLYRLMGNTCAWHIYHEATGIQDGHRFKVDTSEGYLLDKSDRIFWDRVYISMSSSDPDEEEANDAE